MAKHVRVGFEGKPRLNPRSLDHSRKARRRERGSPLAGGCAPTAVQPGRAGQNCSNKGRLCPHGRARRHAAKLGFKAHPHMLRHACGHALANRGHDTRALQAYLGHRNIQHTVRYTEMSPTRFKDFWRN